MKKGFTLIELLVSFVLLSIVIVFITNFVVNIRDQKLTYNVDIDLMVNQASIARMINSDIAQNGIKQIKCETDKKCEIIFLDEEVKLIEITNDNKSLKYYNADEVFLIRTLKNAMFSRINFSSRVLEHGSLHKMEIHIQDNEEYNIKLTDYNSEKRDASLDAHTYSKLVTNGADCPSSTQLVQYSCSSGTLNGTKCVTSVKPTATAWSGCRSTNKSTTKCNGWTLSCTACTFNCGTTKVFNKSSLKLLSIIGSSKIAAICNGYKCPTACTSGTSTSNATVTECNGIHYLKSDGTATRVESEAALLTEAQYTELGVSGYTKDE